MVSGLHSLFRFKEGTKFVLVKPRGTTWKLQPTDTVAKAGLERTTLLVKKQRREAKEEEDEVQDSSTKSMKNAREPKEKYVQAGAAGLLATIHMFIQTGSGTHLKVDIKTATIKKSTSILDLYGLATQLSDVCD